ncbi:hypothetical protein N9174_04025 [bacterium]|nr:hypothetical protein [bacterium]
MRAINKIQVLIGVSALFIGLLVYLFDRPSDHTYFVYTLFPQKSPNDFLLNLFGPIGRSLPSLLHVFSFTLITTGLMSCQKRGCLIIGLVWLFIDCLFEVGQKLGMQISQFVPDFFSGIPILENTKSFFLRGTFDVYDLVAITIGAIAAQSLFWITTNRRGAL